MADEGTGARERASIAGKPLAGLGTVVTGGSSGIGRAIALAYARAGADVLLTYRRSEAAAAEVAEGARTLGVRAFSARLDLARPEDIERVVAEAFERLPRVDVWVNNAGADILTGESAHLAHREKLDLVLAVDLRGTVLCSWAVAERMRAQGGGRIVNMSWDHVAVGMEGRDPEIYAAAEFRVLGEEALLRPDDAAQVTARDEVPGPTRKALAAREHPILPRIGTQVDRTRVGQPRRKAMQERREGRIAGEGRGPRNSFR